MKLYAVALAVLAVTSCGPLAATVQVPAQVVAPGSVPVLKVVDGDTLDVPEGRVRVLVMDSCERGTRGGQAATADARRLLAGRRVTLAGEPGADRDRYGRLLRYVTLPDGRDYATVMLGRSHTGVYGGRSDASPARMAAGRAADRDGRSC